MSLRALQLTSSAVQTRLVHYLPQSLSSAKRIPRQTNAIGNLPWIGIGDAGTCFPNHITSEISRKSRVVCRSSSDASPSGNGSASSAPDKPTVGFLGLGIMGTAMATNLVKAGFEVTVWNRNTAKCEPLVEAGARQAVSPEEVTRGCDITFAVLADPAAAIAVATGIHGAIDGLRAGKGYIDVSTVDAPTSRKIAQLVRKKGATFLEAPVSGSKKPAENGTLIFLTAGDKALFDHASSALDVMGKAKFFLGEVGNGAHMKLVVNMVMGSMMASFCEGVALAETAGIDGRTLLDVISQGAVASPLFTMKGPSMLDGRYTTAFPLKHQQKDMRLAVALGDELALPLPVAAAANELYKRARSKGLEEEDFSAVLEAVRKEVVVAKEAEEGAVPEGSTSPAS